MTRSDLPPMSGLGHSQEDILRVDSWLRLLADRTLGAAYVSILPELMLWSNFTLRAVGFFVSNRNVLAQSFR